MGFCSKIKHNQFKKLAKNINKQELKQ